MSAPREREYVKATMTIVWRAKLTGRTHTRHVDLGCVRTDADFDGLAVLNVGIRGSVVSHVVERAA